MNQGHRLEDLSGREARERGECAVGSTQHSHGPHGVSVPWTSQSHGDRRKEGGAGRPGNPWGSEETYTLMNWKRLIFNTVICYAVML